jgi:hypothetical protein
MISHARITCQFISNNTNEGKAPFGASFRRGARGKILMTYKLIFCKQL